MASGLFECKIPLAVSNTLLYTCPVDTLVTANLSMCNQGTYPALVRVALVKSGGVGALTTANYVEYERIIPPGESYERTALVLHGGASVVVWSDTGTVSFVIYGHEQALI